MKNLLKNQTGISMAFVLVAIVIVGIGTRYIIDISGHNQVVASKARTTTLNELERRRISTLLADTKNCEQNFKNNALGLTYTTLSTFGGKTIVTTYNPVSKLPKYFNNQWQFVSAKTQIDPFTTFTGTDKQYEIILTYSPAPDYYNNTVNYADKAAGLGKKSVIIRIPLYLKIDTMGKIQTCYAMTENKEIDTFVTQACSPATKALANYYGMGLLTGNNSAVADCEYNVTTNSCAAGTALAGYTITNINTVAAGATANGNIQDFTTAGICRGFTQSSNNYCSPGQSVYYISGGSLSCGYAGADAKDNDANSALCANGQLLWRTSPTNTVCVTASCSGYQFIQTITSAGATCYQAPTTSCGANQYVSAFNSGGSDTCSDLPIISGSCAAGTFGSSLTRATATSGGTLNCTAYSKAKSCSPSGVTTFVYGFTAGGANCTTW